MFNIKVDYPDADDEYRIVEATTSNRRPRVERVVNGEDFLAMQSLVRDVPAAPHVIKYAMRLARATRPDAGEAPEFVRKYVTWGAGPRASQYLILGAKARAVLHGRTYAATDDVRAIAGPVLRHRIITNYNAEAERIKPDDIVSRLLLEMGDASPV